MKNNFNENLAKIGGQLEKIQLQLNKHDKEGSNEWLGIEEASQLLKLSKSSIYKRTMNHSIPFYKFSKKLMFRRSELEEFINNHKHCSSASNQGIDIEE